MTTHQVEAVLGAHADCQGLAGRQIGIAAALVGQSSDTRKRAPAPPPAPTKAPEGTIDLGPVNLRPWGR